MALKTFGTNATTSLLAVQFGSNGVLTDSDLAAFNAEIQPNYGSTSNPNNGKLGTYIGREGQLWVPQRGWIKVFGNDWLVVDATTGFPFLLSSNAVASGPYTHT